jgi:hypothetical protein
MSHAIERVTAGAPRIRSISTTPAFATKQTTTAPSASLSWDETAAIDKNVSLPVNARASAVALMQRDERVGRPTGADAGSPATRIQGFPRGIIRQRSSASTGQPWSANIAASVDLPAADGPHNATARPPITTTLACSSRNPR